MTENYYKKVFSFLFCFILIALKINAQGNRLSIQATGPKNLSICGINDTAYVEVYNISSGTVSNITVKLNLPPGINYVKSSILGTGVSEGNVSNLNQPVFTCPNLALAKNFKFKLLLTSDCNLLSYLNSNNSPAVNVRADYLGNYDVGNSIPFSVKVPSVQFGTISNLSFTGDVGSKFIRSITIGNYGKGPLREIKLVRYNGKDVQTFFVNKGVTVYKGDTVITTFGSSFFKTIGNLDTFLDQNETITLVDSNVMKSCKLLSTNFELTWGCNGKACQVSKISGSALISNKTPNLKAIPMPVYPTCYNNNTFVSQVKFVNTGSMTAISPRVGISANYYYVFSTFDTNTVRIKVGHKGTWIKPLKDSTAGSYNLGQYGCIGLYPIGLFRVKCPDLKPNDTLFVTWSTTSCTPSPCSNTSIVVNSWAYWADYKDQCKNTKTVPWTWGKVYDQHYMSSSAIVPTDLINNQTGEFRIYINSASMLARSSSASYVVDIILPKGLLHSKKKSDLYFINSDLTTNWNPDSISQIGDTIRGYFPHPVPINLNGSELVYYLKADCSKSGANGMQTIKTQFRYIPDRSCGFKEWIFLNCQTHQVKIHCVSNCAGGMKFRNFRVQRISFGKPDNNNDGKPDGSGSLDTLKIREERCMVGDTLLSEYFGVIRRTSSIITWRNAYIESTLTYGKHLDIAGIQLLVWRRGVTLSVNCNQIKSWKTVSGNNATFKIDLSTDSMQSCVSSGFRYSNDDSLVVKVKYRVSGNIGGTIQNITFNNRFYTSNVTNPTSNSNKFQCDTFSGQMILTGYFFTTCCKETYQVNSCSQINVNNYFYLGIGGNSYGGNNYFPYEYRNFAKLKSVKFYVPNGFKLNNSYLGQYRTSGSNKTTLETKDTIKSSSPNSNPIVYDVSKYITDSSGGVIYPSDDGFHGYFVAQMNPSCEIQTTNKIQLKYDFVFERRGTLGSGFDTITSGLYDEVVYNKPVYTINPVAPTIYAAKDTAEWEIVFTNYSPSFSNINTWFSPDNSGAIKIVEIRDAGKDTLLPSNNLVFRAGVIPYNNSRKFKVKAIYNSCKKDSVILYSGWNCLGYPNDLSTYTCSKERIALYLEPQNTQYQVSLSDSISVADLCSSTPYTMTIENIGATTGYNTKAILNLPIGMNVVSGSCYIKYPHKSGKTAIPTPTLKSGTTYEWNLANISSAIQSGFKGVGDTNRNKIIITFRVQTNCDYSSGNYIRASASGNIKCGDAVQAYPAISNPLNIKGVTRPYYTLLKVEADTVFPCEKASKVRVKIINLGPGKTGSEDKYQAVLIPGLSYDSALYSAYYNAPNNNLTKIRNINGASEVEFSLQDSIIPGDSMYFEFGFNSDGSKLNCGNIDLYSQTAVKQEVTCVADNSKCKINVVTGNNIVRPQVQKGSIAFSNLESKLNQTLADSEKLDLKFRIRNNGDKILYDNSVIYKIIYDKDGSGTVSSGDVELDSDTFSNGLEKGEYSDINKTISVKAGMSCALFVSLDSASCSCGFAYSKFPMPALYNAGNDRSICSGDTIKLGIPKVNAYRYLWTPGIEFNSDTLAQPFAVIENTDSVGIFKQYVLTTYRGFCFSKDTVEVEIYKLPELRLIQKDTTICAGNQVLLKASSQSGTGLHNIIWTPYSSVKDSSSFNTLTSVKGTDVIKALVTDSKGCTADDSLKVTVKARPKAKFTYPETCAGLPVALTDSSVISGDSIAYLKWSASGTDTLNVKTLTMDFGGNPDMFIALIAGSDYGCKDTFARTVYLNPYPVADFTLNNVCEGDSVFIKNSSTISEGSISSLKWETGDGTTYTLNQFAHLYANADTFDVVLSVESDKKCADTFSRKVVVYNRPEPDFDVADVCLGDTVKAIDKSSIMNDSIIYRRWLSGGIEFINIDFEYPFGFDSVHHIKLITVSSKGCSDSVIKSVDVYSNPKAQFDIKDVCQGDSSEFIDASNIRKGSIVGYEYDFGDGNKMSVSEPRHLYVSGDTFDIRLIVKSDKNCKDTHTMKTIVHPEIIPDFTVQDICVSDVLDITDISTFVNTDIDRWIYTTGMDTVEDANPTFRFDSAGTYNIKLTVISTEGCRYDTVRSMTVYPLPEVDFKDTNECVDNRFTFVSQAKISSGSINSYDWHFGDNTTSNVRDPYHEYPGAGNYNVKLIASSDFGCVDSIEKVLTAFPTVIVSFTSDSVCLGDLVTFKDKSLVPSSFIKKYEWDFGDGDTSMIRNPYHLYDSPDTFVIRLNITTGYDCEYDTTSSSVIFPVPIAGFTTDPDQGTIVNPEINFSDISIGADTIQYDLGDGKNSFMRNLVNSYPDSGTFIISQRASNIYGCSDTFRKEIKIRYLFVFNTPTAFSPNDDGNNDLFAPGGIGFGNYSMWIYNRWGELVFQTETGEAWDGTYMGEPVSQDVFAVKYKVRDFKGRWHYYSSSFTLIR